MKSKPNFSAAYTKANEILVSSRIIDDFPYSVFDLVSEQSQIKCRTYKKALKYGLNIADFGSDSAVIFELNGKSIIFYNDKKPIGHVKYSILHELGHPINGHDYRKTDSLFYQKYEIETNFFAAQLLMPEQIIREFQKRGKRISCSFLQEHFEVSNQAAEKRLRTLAKTNDEWRSRMEKEFDDVILFKYQDFINKVCPIQKKIGYEDDYDLQLEREKWLQ